MKIFRLFRHEMRRICIACLNVEHRTKTPHFDVQCSMFNVQRSVAGEARLRVISLLLLVTLLVGACRQRDIRTVTIDVPQLQGQECKQLLRDVLAPMNGVRGADLILETGSVTVTYDSMRLALKNLEYAIAGAGFQANEIPADTEAREALPERCR